MFRTANYTLREGGYKADNTTQLNKVNKGRQKGRILEKMIICIINMYQLLVA